MTMEGGSLLPGSKLRVFRQGEQIGIDSNIERERRSTLAHVFLPTHTSSFVNQH
jgi:hypothetical protein